jgi:amidohydrolase
MRQDIIDRMGRIVTNVAAANGATARLEMMPAPNPVLVNDPALTARVTESLRATLGPDAVKPSGLLTVGEDFAYIAKAVPSVYYWIGVTPPSQDPKTAPDNHSDLFYVDEPGISVGMRTLLHVAVDYLQAAPAAN